ncbi:MAG TPA: amidohydrolase family protein [Gemmatimonadales bacterium]|nr:amidohydrolase family protein [Gemmatimonadales bacterium]
MRTTDDPRRVPLPPRAAGGPTVVLRGGRVFDGTGAAARPGTVVITGDRIASILAPGATTWPTDAKVLDVTGKTVLPGLIDMHTHLTYTEPGVSVDETQSQADAALRGMERLRFYLESGITSIRDVASQGMAPYRLKDWQNAGRIPGPRIFLAGQLITGTGGHGAEGLSPSAALNGAIREASGPDDWREAVREQFKNGADVIKIASHFGKAEVAAAVEEAHALGIRVTCDCETFYIEWAVDAGVDMIEHPLPRTDGTIQKMASKGVASIPTVVPYDYIFDAAGGYWGSTSRRFAFSKAANVEMIRRLKRAGVTVGVGTDLVVEWFRYMPEPYITELGHLVEAGFTPAEALVAATKTNAALLDLADRLGTLEAGKLADVLVVRGTPDSNVRDLVNVDLVITNGRIAVQDGKVVIDRHVPIPPPKAR